jgi:serine/threonine-protein kinase
MAPEQVAQTLENDHRVDIYALGCVVYEMIAGRLPFAGEKLVEVMFKHVNEPPPPPRRFNPDIPEAVEQLVLEALAKDPEERPSSATKFIEDLRLAFNL